MKKQTKPTDLKAIEAERTRIYGDPEKSHRNIGLSWTGLLQQHYGLELPHPIPPEVVALMLTTFKCQRSCRVYYADNFDDGHIYLDFAQRFQKKK